MSSHLPYTCPRPAAQRGVFLLEMALVLALMAVVLLPLGAAQRTQAAAARQQALLAERSQVAAALEAFVLTHGRLPCPALQANAQEARQGNACQAGALWLPSPSLGLPPLATPWRLVVANLQAAGAPAANALTADRPFALLSPQQLTEIIYAPTTPSLPVGSGPLPAIHLCQLQAGLALPAPTQAGCGGHPMYSPAAVAVMWPDQPEFALQNNRQLQFFIDPQNPSSTPLWLSYERLNGLWLQSGAAALAP